MGAPGLHLLGQAQECSGPQGICQYLQQQTPDSEPPGKTWGCLTTALWQDKPRRGPKLSARQVTNTVLLCRPPHRATVSVGHHLTERSLAQGLTEKPPVPARSSWDDPDRSVLRTHLVRSQERLHPKAHAANESTLSGRTIEA